MTAEEGAEQTVQVAQESAIAQKKCCHRKAANYFGHLITLPSYLYFFLQQMTFPIPGPMPQSKDEVKPILIAIFLSQTRNLKRDSSAVSEGGTSCAGMCLWKMEPFPLLFLEECHNVLLP